MTPQDPATDGIAQSHMTSTDMGLTWLDHVPFILNLLHLLMDSMRLYLALPWRHQVISCLEQISGSIEGQLKRRRPMHVDLAGATLHELPSWVSLRLRWGWTLYWFGKSRLTGPECCGGSAS